MNKLQNLQVKVAESQLIIKEIKEKSRLPQADGVYSVNQQPKVMS